MKYFQNVVKRQFWSCEVQLRVGSIFPYVKAVHELPLLQ